MECHLYKILHLITVILLILRYKGVKAVRISNSKIDLPIAIETQSVNNEYSSSTIEFEEFMSSSTEVTANVHTNSAIMDETAVSYLTDLTEWPEFPPKIKTIPTITSSEFPTTKPVELSSTSFTTTTSPINSKSIEITNNKTDLSTQPYCLCNLELNQCDLNCCCDPDCNNETRNVFNCALQNATKNTEGIDSLKHFRACAVKSDWFCLFRASHNSHPTRDVTREYFDTSHQYTWSNFLPTSIVAKEQINQKRDYYKINEPIQIYDNNSKDIRYIELPIDFHPPLCQLKEPIRHLATFQRSCLISTAKELQQILMDLVVMTKYANILKKPNFSNVNSNPEDILSNSKPIELLHCNSITGKCFVTNSDDNNTIEQQLEQYLPNTIIINISHNYTQLAGMSMELWCLPRPKDAKTFAPIWLHLEVNFLLQSNNERNHLNIISGPLGYLLGKPVIISKMIARNKSLPLSKDNQILSYFDNSTSHQPTLRIIDKHQGFCQQAKIPRHFVSYGINMAIGCKLHFNNATVLDEAFNHLNFTNICQQLQKDIYQQLLNTNLSSTELDSSIYISQLGRPKNQSNTWLPLSVRDMMTENSIIHHYNDVTKSFICHNIQLSVGYEFHIGKFLYDGIPHQQLIKRARVNFGRPYDVEFTINETIVVPIMTTVRFYDLNDSINSKAIRITNHYYIYLIFATLLKDFL